MREKACIICCVLLLQFLCIHEFLLQLILQAKVRGLIVCLWGSGRHSVNGTLSNSDYVNCAMRCDATRNDDTLLSG